jgi:two-component system, NtrC family, sensor histidine kinase HydH
MTGAGPIDRFNIRLWFAATSFVVIAAMAVAFAFLMSDFVAHRLLHREAEVTQEFLQSIVAAEHSAGDVFDPTTPENREALESFADHVVNMPGIYRANMYDPRRAITWSTDRALIGRSFPSNDELEVAFRGELLVEVGALGSNKPEHTALERVAPRRFVEAYIPIKDHGGKVTGVVELYKSPDALDATIRRGRELIWIGAGAGALILYATLFWIVQRGARLIDRQQARLTEMETMAVVGQMAGALAHSLRNPLAAIRSSAELLRVGDADGLRQVSGEIIADVDRMDRHVRDLLTYTRAESRQIERIDPYDIAVECVSAVRHEIDRQGIAVEASRSGLGDGTISADRVLLHQAIASIVTNAVEAMPQGGRLVVLRDIDQPARRVRLSLRDSGTGIAAEALCDIGKPFFTTKARGLGLGIVLARRIVERFGGRLTIESKPGQGTLVTLEFERRR